MLKILCISLKNTGCFLKLEKKDRKYVVEEEKWSSRNNDFEMRKWRIDLSSGAQIEVRIPAQWFFMWVAEANNFVA